MNSLQTIDNFCELSKTSLSFTRDVTREEWQTVFNALNNIEGCVQFWIGDCLKYREQKWGMYDDIIDESGLEKETLKKYNKIASHIEEGLRRPELTFSHHEQVAFLEPDKQKEVLTKASEDHLSVRQTRELVKAIKKESEEIIELPNNKYQVIYADPAWKYNDTCENGAIQSRGVDNIYKKTMSIDELCDLKVSELSQKNAVLFIWVTSPFLEDVFSVISAWGFKYKASFVWDKIKHNMGHYNSVRHELLLICTKGSCTPDNLKLYDSVQSIERGEHSAKPHEFYDIIETLYSGKKIELFARNTRPGWDSWGNEID